jgi:hypothetical protein
MSTLPSQNSQPLCGRWPFDALELADVHQLTFLIDRDLMARF